MCQMAHLCSCLDVACCYELPRMPLPRTRVNKGTEKGRCCIKAPTVLRLRAACYRPVTRSFTSRSWLSCRRRQRRLGRRP
jgi:hypothetical protein